MKKSQGGLQTIDVLQTLSVTATAMNAANNTGFDWTLFQVFQAIKKRRSPEVYAQPHTWMFKNFYRGLADGGPSCLNSP